jgi:UDP-N-acetylmuramoyl-tripeptide--D-alanyl-D-alanine ligase
VALQQLAHGWRAKFAVPVVAVTGSNGKTTVKGMIASIFAAAVGEEARLATTGNLNNDIGVPLTLLRMHAAHRLAVIELGMNHPGETAVLAKMTQPTIALINNAQREHQEFMATVEAVALEHASVIHALPDGGHAVFPADDVYAGIWRVAATDRQIVDFALDHDTAAVRGTRNADGSLHVDTPSGAFDATLNVIGDHNLRNALAATAAAWSAGVALDAIRAGLEAFEPVSGRLQRKHAKLAGLAHAAVIDDTYNANPDSMRAAIDVLAAQPGFRALVIGDMGEVGDHANAFHREIGDYARDRGIDALFALGDETRESVRAYGAHAAHFDAPDDLIAALVAAWQAQHGNAAGDASRGTILVKGSRFMRMERIVRALTLEGAPDSGAH